MPDQNIACLENRMTRRLSINLFDLVPSGNVKDSAGSCQILRSDSKNEKELMEFFFFEDNSETLIKS